MFLNLFFIIIPIRSLFRIFFLITCPPQLIVNILDVLCIYVYTENGSAFRVLVAQSCPTLRLHDCNPLGPSVHGILQAGVLEWVVILFSREPS